MDAERPILEGLVTTRNVDRSINLSPMGPRVDPEMRVFELRPFQTSTTYRNLKSRPEGVLHVVDDVELLARAAIGRVDPLPDLVPASAVDGMIVADACRWYAFRAEEIEDDQPRTSIRCRVVDQGRGRDFFGFNRAKHAVVEAAILATRRHLLPASEIEAEFARLSVIVEKTAGEQERRAFALLRKFVEPPPS